MAWSAWREDCLCTTDTPRAEEQSRALQPPRHPLLWYKGILQNLVEAKVLHDTEGGPTPAARLSF